MRVPPPAPTGKPAPAATAELMEASRTRLHYWDLTDRQINRIGKTRKVRKTITIFSALLVLFTPLLACMISLIPFYFVFIGVIDIEKSIIFTIGVDLSLIFLSGLAFGGEKRFIKGVRMTVLGTLIFIVGYLLNNLIQA